MEEPFFIRFDPQAQIMETVYVNADRTGYVDRKGNKVALAEALHEAFLLRAPWYETVEE